MKHILIKIFGYALKSALYKNPLGAVIPASEARPESEC